MTEPAVTAREPAIADRSFPRAIGLARATALVVGIIIGASIFVQPSEITREVPGVRWILLAWTAAGLLSLAGALICAELASAFPGTGGVYLFLHRTLSPAVAFLWGWAMFWSMHTGIIAAVAMINARYLAYFIPLNEIGLKVVAISVLFALSAVNYYGVRQASWLQSAFTVVKIAAIAILVILGFGLGARIPEHFAGSHAGQVPVDAFLRAVGAGLFAFGGWHMVTYTAEETREPTRTLPRALVLGMLIVITAYLALNTLYLYVLPLERVIASQRVAADAADALLGSGGGGLLAGLVVFSTVGALAGLILAGPRVYFAMAERGQLFRWIAAVHPQYRTPARAIVLQAIWAAVLVATGSYRALFSRVIYTEWIFFALLATGLLLARRQADYAPAYRIWGYPLVPVAFALAALAVAINQLAANPVDSAIGLFIVLLGLPIYHAFIKDRSGAELAHH